MRYSWAPINLPSNVFPTRDEVEAAAERVKVKRALRRYGVQVCRDAFAYSEAGEGPSTVGVYLGLTTQQADAAINAGRALARGLVTVEVR